jgi:hypothetical protein
MREIAVAVRDAIRLMGRELAAAIGKPEAGEEMADDLEIAFLEGRMSVSEGGGLEVLIEAGLRCGHPEPLTHADPRWRPNLRTATGAIQTSMTQ